MIQKPILFCFRNDLRLSDNAALHAAMMTGRPVYCCYVLNEFKESRPLGGTSQWWLHNSLTALQRDIAEKGGELILRRGIWVEQMIRLTKQLEVSAVYFSRVYDEKASVEERQIYEALSRESIDVKRFKGYLLFEPGEIKNKSGGAYKVFTPFWKSCAERLMKPLSTLSAKDYAFSPAPVSSDYLADWCLTPSQPNWAKSISDYWQPGEKGAQKKLDAFLEACALYDRQRDYPHVSGTSQLSPHLHFGEISPRQIISTLYQNVALNRLRENEILPFVRQLVWREFSYYMLSDFPSLPTVPYKDMFRSFPWKDDASNLKAWQQGKTGYPIIDAGMRELWVTGWMHNRVRMIVGSFLVKNLMIPWQRGEEWFWDTLVDADIANNAASWQWVAGCGADAAPYFRIFNPVTQSEKFDGEGHYIRQWLPELKHLSNTFIHKPWQAPKAQLECAGVVLGQTYPYPLVDLKQTREAALAAYQSVKM